MSEDNEPQDEPVEELDEIGKLAAIAAEAENDEEPGEEEEDDGLLEVEIGPTKYRVTKEVKEAWDGMQGAHTKRSQTVAEQERELKSEKELIIKQEEFLRSFTAEVAELKTIHGELQTYQNYTQAQWDAFNNEDPENTSKHWNRFQMLQGRAKSIAEGLQAKAQESDSRQQQQRELARAKMDAALATTIKDWTPQKAAELKTVAMRDYGIPEEVVDNISHPGIIKLANDAYMFRQIQERAKKVTAPKIVPMTVKKPTGTNSRASDEPSDSDSPAEWLRKRNAQEARSRGR
jgi:hypothetical protein